MNIAFRRGIVPTDREWKRVRPFQNASKRRELFLTDQQVSDLLDAAESPAFHALMKAGVLTGARCGELRRAKVRDLDISNRSLHLDGKRGPRDCYLSDDALAFFKRQIKAKLPEASLLPNEEGDAWDDWEHSLKVKRAQLPPETVYYSLHHYPH